MNNIYIKFASLFIVIMLLHRIAPTPLKYPKTEKSKNVIDIYHGDSIIDEYRWLEDDNSKQTKAWVQKQNSFKRESGTPVKKSIPFFTIVL